MTGMFTLFVITCCASIICLFSQEFTRLFKKIFAVKGMKLILPLALASIFVYGYDYLVLEFLFYIRDKLNNMVVFLNANLPQYKYTSDFILVFILTAVTLAPVGILHYLSYRKNHTPFVHPYLLSTLIWIISVALLISLPRLYGQ